MSKHHSDNERIKRKYFIFLKEAKRQHESSIDGVAKAISRFECYTKYRDFKSFHFQQAVGFKKHLTQQHNQKTDKPLSKATLHSALTHLKSFFQWLAMQSGYKSRISYTDTEYFNLSEKEVSIATAKRETPVPTLEQIELVIKTMPAQTDIERRDRALIAFILSTGARDSAVASMKLKHVDLSAGCVHQDAREVRTKFSKTFDTTFFPVSDEIRQIVEDWVNHLKTELLFGNDDPLFPKTKVINGVSKKFEACGFKKEHWKNATPIRTIFKKAFKAAGLPYYNPHSFRKTLTNLGEKICRTPEEFKAWSQSLGHESVMTTFCSYGNVRPERQREIFQELNNKPNSAPIANNDVDAIAEAIVKKLQKTIS
ncbi:MAG: recombinase XerC [Gammaproteobacteria bacterium GWE2_42_36]|nr:MAG: recombinase XerC [Gammaproteobacteria bacterium GWE2_42_36]HCU05528.1 recombinase XerC [Coxiellaceae bacterium]